MSLRSGVLFTINFMHITFIKFQTPDYGQFKNKILFNVVYLHKNFMEMKYLKCLLVLKVTFTNAADTSAGFVISNIGERCGCGDTLGDGFRFLSWSCSFCYNSVPSMGSPGCYVQPPCYETDPPAIYTCVSYIHLLCVYLK